MANTLVDALATHAQQKVCGPPQQSHLGHVEASLQQIGHLLWLVPRAEITSGQPVFRLGKAGPFVPSRGAPPAGVSGNTEPAEVADNKTPGEALSNAPQSVPLTVLTANVQTMKDATSSIFNPSGQAARRHYLMHQAGKIACDVLCIQEARSKAGRWSIGGWLTWRSGHLKGQLGCEIWIRPDIVSPPLQLSSWRIVVSTPRILLITCTDPRLPVSVCSAHAPHADRPDGEATAFWHELQAALFSAPVARALVAGVDANGDFYGRDPEETLVGDVLAAGEAGRNDLHLMECCFRVGLISPATHSDIQLGETWSWEHTSGRRKRLDHVLFKTGPWDFTRASQALDFDIVNTARDHVPLRVVARLYCPRPVPKIKGPRRCDGFDVREAVGGSVESGTELRPTSLHARWIHLCLC